MQKALVTGAAGFIGSHVVRELLAENVEVRCLIRPGESTRNLDGLDVEMLSGDILDAATVEKNLAGVDTVFHLAAIYSTPAEIAYASQYLFDNTKSVTELGLTFNPVKDSLQDSIRWFRENRYA